MKFIHVEISKILPGQKHPKKSISALPDEYEFFVVQDVLNELNLNEKERNNFLAHLGSILVVTPDNRILKPLEAKPLTLKDVLVCKIVPKGRNIYDILVAYKDCYQQINDLHIIKQQELKDFVVDIEDNHIQLPFNIEGFDETQLEVKADENLITLFKRNPPPQEEVTYNEIEFQRIFPAYFTEIKIRIDTKRQSLNPLEKKIELINTMTTKINTQIVLDKGEFNDKSWETLQTNLATEVAKLAVLVEKAKDIESQMVIEDARLKTVQQNLLNAHYISFKKDYYLLEFHKINVIRSLQNTAIKYLELILNNKKKTPQLLGQYKNLFQGIIEINEKGMLLLNHQLSSMGLNALQNIVNGFLKKCENVHRGMFISFSASPLIEIFLRTTQELLSIKNMENSFIIKSSMKTRFHWKPETYALERNVAIQQQDRSINHQHIIDIDRSPFFVRIHIENSSEIYTNLQALDRLVKAQIEYAKEFTRAQLGLELAKLNRSFGNTYVSQKPIYSEFIAEFNEAISQTDPTITAVSDLLQIKAELLANIENLDKIFSLFKSYCDEISKINTDKLSYSGVRNQLRIFLADFEAEFKSFTLKYNEAKIHLKALENIKRKSGETRIKELVQESKEELQGRYESDIIEQYRRLKVAIYDLDFWSQQVKYYKGKKVYLEDGTYKKVPRGIYAMLLIFSEHENKNINYKICKSALTRIINLAHEAKGRKSQSYSHYFFGPRMKTTTDPFYFKVGAFNLEEVTLSYFSGIKNEPWKMNHNINHAKTLTKAISHGYKTAEMQETVVEPSSPHP